MLSDDHTVFEPFDIELAMILEKEVGNPYNNALSRFFTSFIFRTKRHCFCFGFYALKCNYLEQIARQKNEFASREKYRYSGKPALAKKVQ